MQCGVLSFELREGTDTGMPFELNRRRIVGLAVVISFAFGAFTWVSARRAARFARDSAAAAVADSAAAQAKQDSISRIARDSARDGTAVKDTATRKYKAGENPDFAEQMGWPVAAPAPLPGSILPARRIVAYYGNPLSRRMGVLGEYEPQEMLRRFDKQLDEWRQADPAIPVQPALHLIAVVAQGDAGPSGKYRTIMRDSLIEMVYGWAKSRNAILFIDIQTGHSDVRELLPRFDHFLSRPDVHLAIDPEFAMKTSGRVPGARIGTLDAAAINYAASHLAEIVRKNNLPPKVLVVHRFTRYMLTNARNIQLRPEVQVVINMDGWGAPWLKRDSYKDYIVREPVQYTGFKLFYHNDTKKGDPLLKASEVLRLRPQPLYIQYQ